MLNQAQDSFLDLRMHLARFTTTVDRAEKRLRMSLIRPGKPGNITKMAEFLKT